MKRKPTPVTIIHFPVRRGSAARTVPELVAVSATDKELPLSEIAPGKRATTPRRTPTPARAVTFVEQKAEDVERGMTELAALGHSLFTQGRVQEARAVFEGLVASGPRDSYAHTMLGTIYLALEAFDRALALFEAALQIDSADVPALVYRGEIRFKQRKLKPALEDFKRAIDLGDPQDPFVDRARRLLRMAKRMGREKR